MGRKVFLDDRLFAIDVVLVNVEASVDEASKIIMDNIGCLIVYERSQPAGTVKELDLALKVVARE